MSSRFIDAPVRLLVALLLGAVAGGCGPGAEVERLLREGRSDEVLRRVRPVGARALRLRAAALRQQGKLAAARTELRLALGLDERSAASHRLMGLLEAEAGQAGAAVAHLERALELDPRQPDVRAALSPLLLQRALLRADPALGLEQVSEARRDLRRAGELDARLAEEGRRLFEALGGPASQRPASNPARSATCTGVPAALALAGLPRPARCTLPARRLIEENRRRHLLVACQGVSLALRLESAGCLGEAISLWSLLAEEAPHDPRWPLQLGRLHLAEGREALAELHFTDHVFLSPDRSVAHLQVGELLLQAARPRQAGARAVEALALAGRLEHQLAALRLLRRAGLRDAVEQAERAVMARGWGLSEPELRARLTESR